MKRMPLAFCFSPEANLLGKAAVIGHGPAPEFKTEFVRRLLQFCDHLFDIETFSGKQLGKGNTLFRNFRVQGKTPPVNLDAFFLPESFSTHGNEITPGSDIIRKNLDFFFLIHFFASKQIPEFFFSAIAQVFFKGTRFLPLSIIYHL